MILDRTAGEPNLSRGSHRLGDAFRRVAEPLFQIRGHWQVGRPDDGAAMRESLLFRNATLRHSERKRHPCARRRKGRKTHGSKNAGRTNVPRIGDDESPILLMEGTKNLAFVCAAQRHFVGPFPLQLCPW